MMPSIGRIVHVVDEKETTLPAIITCVHSETCINVTVFNENGLTHAVTSLVKVEDTPKYVTDWNWPPRV